jgi:hypothetical protein
MRRPVRVLAAVALAGALAGAGAACRAEVHPGETQGLGLRGAQVPDVLKAVAADPYRAPAAPACETIPAELLALDQALGPDAGEPRKRQSQVVRLVGGAVRSMVPYRDVVRFLTRADHHDHQLMDATMAGFARRGFLRGLEATLRCAEPATEAASAPDLTPALPPAVIARAETPGVPVSYAPSEPDRAPSEQTDLVALRLVVAPPAPTPNDTLPDPGR